VEDWLYSIGEEIGSIQERVAIEPESRSVKIVGAGLGDSVQDGARIAPELRVNAVRDDLDFVDAVWIRQN